MELKPVGQRPRCLYCKRELKPRFKRVFPPIMIDTGEIGPVRAPGSFGGEPKYTQERLHRPITDAERKQFRKDHPPEFSGCYGGYGDNRFCGLNCAYKWAIGQAPKP